MTRKNYSPKHWRNFHLPNTPRKDYERGFYEKSKELAKLDREVAKLRGEIAMTEIDLNTIALERRYE